MSMEWFRGRYGVPATVLSAALAFAAQSLAAQTSSGTAPAAPAPSALQSLRMSGDATVDSAAVARAAYRDAGRASDMVATQQLITRAAAAWPGQPAYLVALARIAARRADTVVMQKAIAALLSMDLGGALLADTVVQRQLGAPTAASTTASHATTSISLASRLAGTGATVGRASVAVTIADTMLFAEGVAAHPRTGALYVTSVRQRTIVEVFDGKQPRDLRVGRAPDVGAILGVQVAPDGATLYATSAPLPVATNSQLPVTTRATQAQLLRIRIADGAVLERWALPGEGASHIPGDLTIAPDGTVLLTDSNDPAIYRLRPGAATLERIHDARFRSLQGIAIDPKGQRAVVADYSHGLFVIDLRTDRIERLRDAPGTTVLGLDGLLWHDNGVLAMQNGVAPARLIQVSLDLDQQQVEAVRVLYRDAVIANAPTLLTRRGETVLFVANSQWDQYDDAGQRRAGTSLDVTRVLCMPLPSLMPAKTSGAVLSATDTIGKRSTASVPLPPRSCSVSDARSP